MAQTQFKVMTDENIANAVTQQLLRKGIDAIRLIDVLPEGTPDPDVLEYCYRHRYSIITLDEQMRGHIIKRASEGKEHAGVFIGTDMQNATSIGIMVEFVAFYDQAIKSGAATVENDVYNQIIYVK